MSEAARTVVASKSQRLLVGVVVFAVAAIILLPIGLLSFGEAFTYTVGPTDMSSDISVQKKRGTAFTIFGRVLVYSDTVEYEVSSPGFESATLALSRGSDQRAFHVELNPLPGYLDVVTNSEVPVTVEINGIAQSTLSNIKLAPGTYAVTAMKGGQALVSQSVEIEGFGRTQQVEFDLSNYRAFLRIATNPRTATIAIDGVVVGQGLYDGGIASGSSRIELKNPGYAVKSMNIAAEMSQRIDLGTVALSPSPVRLTLSSVPSGASVLLDGKFVGETDTQINLTPLRKYELSVRKPGFSEHRAIIVPSIGKNLTRKVDFDRKTIQVEVKVNPRGTVSVNGIAKGNAPVSIQVHDGDVIEAGGAGLAPQSATVELSKGSKQSFTFDLYEPAQHAYRFAPKQLTVSGNLQLRRFPALRYQKTIDGGNTMTVEITRPFYLATTEVTEEAFKLYRASSPGSTKKPVTNVTWIEAAKFCNWLSTQQGLAPFYAISQSNIVQGIDKSSLGFRLPTEWEWETGASYDWQERRVLQPYEWGSAPTIPIAFGNLAGREIAKTRARHLAEYMDNHESSAPVASYRPNFNGLFDMTGNVAEWVHDYYQIRREINVGPDYSGPKTGFTNVVKGASFETDDLDEATTHHRSFLSAKSPTVGFRIAKWIY